MILDVEKNCESVVEIYGGFPLKEDFLDAGNTVLAEWDMEAEYVDGVIRIPFICRPYYTEDELDDWRDEGCTEDEIRDMRKAMFHVDLLIGAENPAAGITDVSYDFFIDGEEVYDDIEVMDDHVTAEDCDRMIEIAEAFLNWAVDAS